MSGRLHGPGIWQSPFGWVSLGSVALVFLAALESLAVTTVMPVIAADLDGQALYALAFAGTLATSVIGMVCAGSWADRSGPAVPLSAAVVLFVAGLLVAGLAPDMVALIVGRLLQGLGAGGMTVSLYVVIARVYPSALHGRILAAFAAAWVLPALVGPFLAGAVTELLHWRWVFLGVVVLSAAAYALLLPRLSRPELRFADDTERVPFVGRLLWAVAVAAGVLVLSIAAESGTGAALLVIVGAVVVVVAIRPLLPPRTLRSGRGLPSVILLRGAVAGAFFSAEIYVPYVFIDLYGFSPIWAGLALTGAAVMWAAGSEAQGRVGDRWGDRRILGGGLAVTIIAMAVVTAGVALHLPPIVLIVAWTLGGGGMGLLYPRITMLMLAASTEADQGRNSAALSIAEATGAATAIAAAGIVVVALGGGVLGFVGAFLLSTLIALAGGIPATRTTAPIESRLEHPGR
ncbi:MFS transporter [Microbacterium sp. A1-JK]|uniref:MFS transporter n=1 Tax=Microbacterium sp. A1-JK TaxID=3177516 RepID=UPI00388B243D